MSVPNTSSGRQTGCAGHTPVDLGHARLFALPCGQQYQAAVLERYLDPQRPRDERVSVRKRINQAVGNPAAHTKICTLIGIQCIESYLD
jgi:hypothetical protein